MDGRTKGSGMGEELLAQIATATGLPAELVKGELLKLIEAAGLQSGTATLEDVRAVLAEYVQDVLLEAKDRFSEPKNA